MGVTRVLDSDLWDIWTRACVLTLKCNFHPSGLSVHGRKWKRPTYLLICSLDNCNSKKGGTGNFCRLVQQGFEVWFCSIVPRKGCQLYNMYVGIHSCALQPCLMWAYTPVYVIHMLNARLALFQVWIQMSAPLFLCIIPNFFFQCSFLWF